MKKYIIVKRSRPKFKIENHLKPYPPDRFDSIPTGLGGKFTYSPVFKFSKANVLVELTGSRKKDYQIAERVSGKKHIPKVTVWHHTWKMVGSSCLMQLVMYDEHQQTCPHAGGCKAWEQQNPFRHYHALRDLSMPLRSSERQIVSEWNPVVIPKNYCSSYMGLQKGNQLIRQCLAVSQKNKKITCRKFKTVRSCVEVTPWGDVDFWLNGMKYRWDHEYGKVLICHERNKGVKT